MSSKLLLPLLSLALLLPLNGAALAAPVDSQAEAAELVREGESEGLLGQWVFQLLLGEVALQRGEAELAASAYQDLALRTRDPLVVRRAIELSGAVHQYANALVLARLWVSLEPESVAARQSLAGLLVVAGRIEELDEPVADMLAREPDSLAANFLGLNRLLARHQDKQAVLAFLERMAQPYPQLAEAHYALALAALAANQPDRARAEARQAQSLKPTWELPVILEAQALLADQTDAGREAAIDILQAYLEKHPDAVDVRLHLARVLIGAKNYPEARKHFDALLKQYPDNTEVIYPVAMLALQERDLETARRQLARLLELPFPDRGAVHYFLGQVEEESGDRAAALQHYAQVSGGAQYLSARSRGARLLQAQGRVDEALAFVRDSRVKAAREKDQLLQLEAQLLREAGRHEAAYQLLNAALQAQPENPDLLYDTALVAEKIGKVQEMERHLKKLIRLEPGNPHALNALGYSLADRGLRLKEAQELIAKAVSLAPEDPYIMDSLGWVFYRQGKLEEARQTLEKAYGIKDDPEIAAHLGEVLWKLGRKEEAGALWQKAVRQAPENETLRATVKKFLP